MGFEWDENKNTVNQLKYSVSFETAKLAFSDPKRIIVHDPAHSLTEDRYFCYGKVDGLVLTVRFTYRQGKNIRIIGAGRWREGRDVYESHNNPKA